MDWLKKLWNALKEPLEEGLKIAWKSVATPYEEKPTRLFGAVPEPKRTELVKFFEENDLAMYGLTMAVEKLVDEGTKVLDRINPGD